MLKFSRMGSTELKNYYTVLTEIKEIGRSYFSPVDLNIGMDSRLKKSILENLVESHYLQLWNTSKKRTTYHVRDKGKISEACASIESYIQKPHDRLA